MFKFADDYAHHLAIRATQDYPKLAKYVSDLMACHTFSYTISAKALEWEDLDKLHEVVQTMVKPYGWVVYKLDISRSIRIQVGKP